MSRYNDTWSSLSRELHRLQYRCDERLKSKSERSARLPYEVVHWRKFVYYETIKLKLNRRLIYECQDRDEVNRRDFFECDGWVCDLDVTGVSLISNIIRSEVTLPRRFPHLDFNWGRTPRGGSGTGHGRVEKKRSVSRWPCKNRRDTKSIWSLPDVLTISPLILGSELLPNLSWVMWRSNVKPSVWVN